MNHNLQKQYDAVQGCDYYQCVVCFHECYYKSDFDCFKCIPKYPKHYLLEGKQ